MQRSTLLMIVTLLGMVAGACGTGPADPNMPDDDMMPDMQVAASPADSAAGVAY